MHTKKKMQQLIVKPKIFLIKSKYLLKTIFSYMSKNRQYHICLRSKRLQSLVDISLATYRIVSFLSNKHLNLDFIQLYETIRLKIPSSTNNDIISCLWDKYSEEQNAIVLTQINHPSISSLNTQINLNNRLNNNLQLNIINNRQFTSQMTSSQQNILKHITIFKYDFIVSTINQNDFDVFVSNLNQLSFDTLFSLYISGLKFNYCLNKNNVMNFISNFTSLKHLTLSNNIFKDEGIALMINNLNPNYLNQLTQINIAENYLTDACIESVELLLKYTQPSLSNLDISSNFFSTKSLKVLCEYFSKLTHLNISNNPINNEGLIHVLTQSKLYLSSISRLSISSLNLNSFFLNSHIEVFSQLQYTPITHLDFSCSEMGGIPFDIFISQIQPISTLQSLELSSFFFNSPKSLDAVSQINRLSLTSCTHIDNVFSYSFNLTNLTFLDIHLDTFSTNYPSLEFLRNNTQLTVLNISECNIHMEAFSSIWKHLINIKELHLSHNCFTSKSVIALSNAMPVFTELRLFDISNSAFDKTEMKLILLNLKQCKLVSYLNISNIQFDYDNYLLFLKLCRELVQLNKLIIINTGINDNQLKDFLENSELLIRLKVLNISKNPINNNGINEIVKKKELFVGLEKLHLMQLVISTQMKEELKHYFGDLVFLK